MTAYRFRVKLAAEPTALWRDVVIESDRLLTRFQAAIFFPGENPALYSIVEDINDKIFI